MYSLGDKSVRARGAHFVAPGAAVIGDVVLGENVSVWFNAVIRADNASIVIEDGSNVQECAVLHVDPSVPMHIGKRVTIGHKAMLHGCSVGDGSLIGMNAVVLNNAVIGKNCLIGANTLVKEGAQIPDGSLVVGSPARVIRQLDAETIAAMDEGTQSYIDKIAFYQNELSEQPETTYPG